MTRPIAGAALLLLAVISSNAVAADRDGATPTVSVPGAAPAQSSFDDLKPMQDSALTETRAGATNVYAAVSSQVLTAVNSGNTINAGSVSSGAVDLDSNAFAGFNGLGNFVINTGNNNNLQGSLSVTINMAPAVGR